jgi:DNA invertase Pin-like site-specific DNA recombinase
MSLPRSLEQLTGLRAARWIRESTAGQFDAFGPDAQREQQDRAIERWGLVDVRLAWHVAHSGRTVASTPDFREMLAAAGVEFDVLVVGYVSRFARDLRTAVNARHELHAAGAVILFADERILTSDEDRWDEWAREAVEAESYSRKLGRRIREGYAAKRRHMGEPGGRPPHGFVRDGRPPRLRPSDGVVQVRTLFAAAAGGRPDRELAAQLSLPLDTVRGILTNPIYIGRLRDGSQASVPAVVDVATWQRVQELRAARRTRGGKPETVRAYALPMLRCAGCGMRLIGDSGRYRHRAPCAAFTAARRRLAYRNRLVRSAGSSYPAELYEGAIGQALETAALSDHSLVEAAADYSRTYSSPVDRLAPRRVEAERQRALERYSRDRDVVALEARMAALDAEESAEVRTSPQPIEWREVLPWLRDLAALWAEATGAERRRIAEQLFDQVDALGCRELIVTPSPAAVAHGLLAGVHRVTVVGATGFGPVTVQIRTPPRLTEPARAAG